MKIIELGDGAVAFEPSSPADRVDAVGVGQLKASGISQDAIDVYLRYGLADSGPAAGDVGAFEGDGSPRGRRTGPSVPVREGASGQ